MYIKLDRDYEVKCTLGTIREIENMFKKPFMVLVKELDKLSTAEQIKLLYAGVKRADSSVRETEFMAECEDNLGLGDLTEYLESFIFELQYPGLTKEEVQQKIEKKLSQAESMKASVGAK